MAYEEKYSINIEYKIRNILNKRCRNDKMNEKGGKHNQFRF